MTDGAGGSSRPPESAAFEPERLGGPRRGRPPVLAAAFVFVLVAVVAVGLSGRLGAGAFPSDMAFGATSAPTPGQSAFDRPVVPAAPGRGLPSFAPGAGPVFTSPPGPMQIRAERHPNTVFVHGDVFAPGVTWVFMSLRDDTGQVGGWASVSVPGAAGPAASGTPTLRFDVELAIPPTFDGHMWVQALAYDARFGLIASARVDTPVATP